MHPLRVPRLPGVGPAGYDTGRIRLDHIQGHVSGWGHLQPTLGGRTRKCWSHTAGQVGMEGARPGLGNPSDVLLGDRGDFSSGICVTLSALSSWHKHGCGGRSSILTCSATGLLVSISTPPCICGACFQIVFSHWFL